MKVNGEEKQWKPNQTIHCFLKQNGYHKERIAIEINGAIIPKSKFDSVVLKKDDCIEIVSFVGGG